MDLLQPDGFQCSSIHVARKLLIAGTSHISVASGKNHENRILDNVSGACYIVSGHGESDDGEGNKFLFYPGCLIQWPPNYLHYRRIYPGLYIDKYLVFPPECYPLWQKMGLVSSAYPVVNLGLRCEIGRRYDEIIQELQNQAELSLPSTMNKAFSFITELLLPRPAEDQGKRIQMERAAERLEVDFQNRIFIPDLAKELRMSYTSFRRAFADFYKMSPIEYRIRKKIERIQTVLSTENPQMKEICVRFGFADIYTFSRQFKKYTGVSPRAFRDRNSLFGKPSV